MLPDIYGNISEFTFLGELLLMLWLLIKGVNEEAWAEQVQTTARTGHGLRLAFGLLPHPHQQQPAQFLGRLFWLFPALWRTLHPL